MDYKDYKDKVKAPHSLKLPSVSDPTFTKSWRSESEMCLLPTGKVKANSGTEQGSPKPKAAMPMSGGRRKRGRRDDAAEEEREMSDRSASGTSRSDSEDDGGVVGFEEDEYKVDMEMSGRLRLRSAVDLGDEEGYGGRVTSKAAVFDDNSEDDDDDDGEMVARGLAAPRGDSSTDDEPSSSGDEDDDLVRELNQLKREDARILSTSHLRTEDDREKGLAVLAQKKVWEKALNIRIRVQKLLSGANRMPQVAECSEINSSFPALGKEYEEVKKAADETLRCLLDFESALSAREGSPDLAPKRAGEGETDRLWRALTDSHDQRMPYIRQEIDRWQRKTTLTTGTKQGLRSLTQTVSSQVRALMEDPALVARRTHIAKSTDHRVLCHFRPTLPVPLSEGGEAEDETGDANLLEDEYDCETYDDAEFYQQVLKEFLESQALTAGDLARARTTKRRKVVDRKASKGRKIRYHVHDKLVNFMVPAAFERPEFANKLFGSLFAYNAQ